jgi:tetratricopeptide (TPR) repeat protein
VQQAARLVEPLARRLETRDFARRWYRASTLRAQAWGCLDEGRHWAIEGLRAVPDDPELLLAMGALHELVGSLSPPFSARAALASRPRHRDRTLAAERDRHAALGRARASFEDALRGAPALHEARLRLGRVEWRLGRPRPARAALEAVLKAADDPRLLYLAHLFLGRLEEDAGRMQAAAQAYRAALELNPGAQSAGVALSHVQFLAGEAAGARETMEDAIAQAGLPDRTDELWAYALGRAEDAERLFEALRAEARR